MAAVHISNWESSYFENARAQFAAYFLRFVQTENDQTLLEMEYPNLIEAVSYYRNMGDHRNLILLRDKLHPFMDLRGHWTDSITLFTWVIDSASAMNDWANFARFTHDKADILNQSGEFKEAEALYKESERIYSDIDKPEMALRSRHMRSMVVRARGDLEQAEKLCESVIADAEKQRLFQWLAHPYYVRALIARDKGSYDQAKYWIEEGLQKLSGTEERTEIAQYYHFLGELAFLQMDYENAVSFLQTSLKISEEIGILRRIAATKRMLGDVDRLQHEYENAQDYYLDALTIVQELGDRPQICRTLLSLGQLEYERNSNVAAINYLKQAKSSYQMLGDARGVVATCFLLLRVYLHRGNWLFAANELADGFVAGFRGGLISYPIIIGALKRWRKW